MSKAKYNAVRGTKDILPDQSQAWDSLKIKAREVFESYGYREIVTPSFERTELFQRGIGQSTEIVQKEMYTFLDKKGRSLTLRPEGTAGVVRSYLEQNLGHASQTVKLYYIGQMFRYERPQTGRYREFWQLGVEAFGSSDPAIDAENIIMLHDYLNSVGLNDMLVIINTMGCNACRPRYLDKLQIFLGSGDGLCEDCRERAKVNPLRAFDCKNDRCGLYLKNAPKISEYLCEECVNDFDAVKNYLNEACFEYVVDPTLVRGFDYYTKTTFEIQISTLGAQNAVAGGGRYDYLVEEFGGSATPAIGFAVGLERLYLALNEPKSQYATDIFVAYIDDNSKKYAFKILCDLRRAGISSDMDYAGRSIKGQLKAASKLGVSKVVIIGPEEVKDDNVKLKEMTTGDEKILSTNDFYKEVKVGI